MIKVSIITVVYNGGNTFEQTVSSVAAQTYPNVEYIVVDGGSNDETLKIIGKYKEYISKWVSEPDKGIYDAMIKGVKMASGDYIQIIGADDCLCDKDAIKIAVGQIESDTDILSCCEYVVDGERGLQRLYSNRHAREKEKYFGGMIPHGGMLVKRELFERYPFDVSYRIAADYKFFLQCYLDETIKFKFIDTPVVFFEINGTTGKNPDICAKENQRIYMELGLGYDDKDQLSKTKECIKKILKRIGIYNWVKPIIDKYILWEKHTCNNKICRWCGRGRML